MYESARLHISIGVYMKIVPASRYATAYILSVVPEVEYEYGLARSYFPYPSIHVRPLSAGSNQTCVCILSERHVSEIPSEKATLVRDKINIFVGSDHFGVLAVVACRKPKQYAVALKRIHRPYDFFECALAPPHVGFFLETFHAYGKSYVAEPLHFLCERLVY